MKRNSSLRRRLVTESFAMTFIVCLLFVAGLFVAFEFHEEVLFEDHLEADLNTYIDHYQLAPEIATIPAENFELYISGDGDKSNFPEFLRNLPVDEESIVADGSHLEIEINEALEIRIIKREGKTFYFVIEESAMENFEHSLMISSLIIMVVICVIAIMLGHVFADHITRPVTGLADRVNSLEQTGAYSPKQPYHGNDEIDILSHAIDAFQDRVNELLARERDFSSDVSHELRTPLMGIQAAAENLRVNKDNPERVLDLASRIESRCKQMNSLVESMLFLARDPGSLENDFNDIGLIDVIHDQLDSASHSIENKQIRTHIIETAMPVIFSSASILSVVFGNLLRNAVIHSESRDINIRLDVSGFTIRDFGLGIPDELKARMFERYVSGVSGFDKGTGIGLVLVKRLCDHFGWGMSVTSSPGLGTTISVDFGKSVRI